MRKKVIVISVSLILVVILSGLYVLFTPFSHIDKEVYVYVRIGDTKKDILSQLDTVAYWPKRATLDALAVLSGYSNKLHTGRYVVSPNDNTLDFFRALRGGHQKPVRLSIPQVRTMKDLSDYVGKHLMIDSIAFLEYISDSSAISKYGLDVANVYCLFIPNTYEVYWNISIKDLLKRMKKESNDFWTKERLEKAAMIPLNPNEVYTLASILDEETANNTEKPDIAGMYINRLRKGMPLQADPTVKFAHHKFNLRRIYRNLLEIQNPYNTYKNIGLPPGPIRIASVEAIDAVLNYTHHDYLFMCAKEDFSGTHRFARTYVEHLKNAARYSKALDKKGIR